MSMLFGIVSIMLGTLNGLVFVMWLINLRTVKQDASSITSICIILLSGFLLLSYGIAGVR